MMNSSNPETSTSLPTSLVSTRKSEEHRLQTEEVVDFSCSESCFNRTVIEKRLLRKLDLRLSLYVLIYIMNLLDRSNIAAARVASLELDLALSSKEYATCLSIVYVGYLLMQVPSNIIVNRISRPSSYISGAMFAWGGISVASGFANNFTQMAAIRFLLGFFEAAFIPGALLLMSKWYTRRELTLRTAILFAGAALSGAFSGIIGAGVLGSMHGVLGHAGWRWLLWIEGAITMAIAFAAAFIVPDMPHNTRGFSLEELEIAQLRITEEVGEEDKDFSNQRLFDGLWMTLKDWKVYIMMMTEAVLIIGLSFHAYFPSITQTLGFDPITTLWYTVEPPLFAVILSMTNAWHADRTQEKFWHIVIPLCLGILGFIICMVSGNWVARYTALFLQASSGAGVVVFFSWIPTSFPRPPAKRAVAIALVSTSGSLGNIAGSYAWDMKDNGFRNSYGVMVAMYSLGIVGCILFRHVLVRLNKKIAELEREQNGRDVSDGTLVSSTDESLRVKRGFRYLF